MTDKPLTRELRYVVHSASPTEIPAKAAYAGRAVDIKVPGLLVELTPEDGVGATLTPPIVEPTAAELAAYVPGAIVTITLNVEAPK